VSTSTVWCSYFSWLFLLKSENEHLRTQHNQKRQQQKVLRIMCVHCVCL
jgi:hypothetical protein